MHDPTELIHCLRVLVDSRLDVHLSGQLEELIDAALQRDITVCDRLGTLLTQRANGVIGITNSLLPHIAQSG